MTDKNIGRVTSVDSFRVLINLSENIKGIYKSGYHGIHEIAKINSYVIIPIGSERIVAIITKVRTHDETEISNATKSIISLPKAERYIVATMIGTINNSGEYIEGVYNFPILDNPVWYLTEEDLKIIFDDKESDEIDLAEDFYLPIGDASAFQGYKVKISPDKLFAKHGAILGNTGSGKSCTVASIIQSLFEYDKYPDGKKIENANIIVFDTNGEYKEAFSGSKYKETTQVNMLYVDEKALKVPYWFMNYADFDYLVRPSEGVQAPILKDAIGLGRNNKKAEELNIIPITIINQIHTTINMFECSVDWKTKSFIFDSIEPLINAIESIKEHVDFELQTIINSLKLVKENHIDNKRLYENRPYVNGSLDIALISKEREKIQSEISLYTESLNKNKIQISSDIDSPEYFEYKKLCMKYIDEALKQQEMDSPKNREYIASLRLRMQSFLNDERIAQPLMLNEKKGFNNALSIFLAFIVGDLFKIGDIQEPENPFSTYYKNAKEKGVSLLNKEEHKINDNKTNQITILDLSTISYDVLKTVTGLIGRLILEFVAKFAPEDRGRFPIVLVLEEAQNYIPEWEDEKSKDGNKRESIAKKVFERIAREGRKYGLSLIVSSQRPSELSKT